MTILNMVGWWASWPKVPLNAISVIAVTWWDEEATITWTDPTDITVNWVLVASWSSTKLVRKVGSAPTNINDWTLVLTETVRDTYSSTWYTDTWLTNGTTYYYAAFSIWNNWLETISSITPSVTPEQQWWQSLDISTATLSKQFATWYGFQWLYINPNENIALTAAYGSTWYVKWYTFTSKDISTVTLDWSSTQTPYCHCVRANPTWTHIYVGKHWNENNNTWTVYEYTTTSWWVSGMSSYKTFTPSPKHTVQTIWLDATETYMVIVGSSNWNVGYQVQLYTLWTPWDVSTATLTKTANLTTSINRHWLYFNDEMTKCVWCAYNASSWTVYQYDRDILNSNSYTQTHTFWPVGFTIWYANVNKDGTTMYAAKESWYIYQYTLSWWWAKWWSQETPKEEEKQDEIKIDLWDNNSWTGDVLKL